MTGPTHIIVAIAATVATGRATGFTPTALQFLALLIGALAPDIDGDGSITKPGRIFKVFLGWRGAKFVDSVLQIFVSILKFFFSHRGFFHAPILGLTLIAIGALLPIPWLFWFGWGYTWHLVADFFTAYGIPIFAPINNRKISGAKIKTGSFLEFILAAVLVVYIALFGWILLPGSTLRGFHEIFLYFKSLQD